MTSYYCSILSLNPGRTDELYAVKINRTVISKKNKKHKNVAELFLLHDTAKARKSYDLKHDNSIVSLGSITAKAHHKNLPGQTHHITIEA